MRSQREAILRFRRKRAVRKSALVGALVVVSCDRGIPDQPEMYPQEPLTTLNSAAA